MSCGRFQLLGCGLEAPGFRGLRSRSLLSPTPKDSSLFADAEAFDQFGVAIRVLALQVIQQAAALSDQLQQAAARVVVLCVRLEMFGEIADPLAEERDLHFRGARVAFVGLETGDDFRLTVLGEHVGPSTNGPDPRSDMLRTKPPLPAIYKRISILPHDEHEIPNPATPRFGDPEEPAGGLQHPEPANRPALGP